MIRINQPIETEIKITLDREAKRITSIRLKNTVTLKVYPVEFSIVTNYRFCVVVHIDLSRFPCGEYEYEAFDGDESVGKGLILIGDYTRSEASLNPEITYKCYGD